jgi:1-acyl-sn-glycerol-3-phosphate acyltransferase
VDPAFARWFSRWVQPILRRAFRPRLFGAEHLPAGRPYLLVANHSAGVGLAEILCLMGLWLERFGDSRPLAGFAHPLGLKIFPASAVLKRVGAVPSTYADAAAALSAGVSLLVFPGGDHETLRPVWQARRVDFCGRRGYLRVAQAAGVPIVPLGIRGSHFTAPMLLRAGWLSWALVVPRLIGMKRWGLSVLGVIVSLLLWFLVPLEPGLRALLIWLWLGSPFVFWPIVPWSLRYTVGPPLEPETLFREDDPDLSAAAHSVQSAVQALAEAR